MDFQTDALNEQICKEARKILHPAGREISVINDANTLQLARRFSCTPRQVHLTALGRHIWPERYVRNHDSLSPPDQIKLLQTRVSVIGAGGLGGYVLQLLARIGIGTLVLADPDRFDETNLNRQAMARTDTIHEFKADAAEKFLSCINPAIDIVAFRIRISAINIDQILDGSHVAVDALDNMGVRRVLLEACARKNIPMVHGALAGFEGRVMSVYPEGKGLQLLHDTDAGGSEPSAEMSMGVPAIAPAFIASLQAMEVLKIVLNRGRPLKNRLIHADLENAHFEEFGF